LDHFDMLADMIWELIHERLYCTTKRNAEHIVIIENLQEIAPGSIGYPAFDLSVFEVVIVDDDGGFEPIAVLEVLLQLSVPALGFENLDDNVAIV